MVIIGEAVTVAGYERSYLYDGWADRGPDSDGDGDEAGGDASDDETETTDDSADPDTTEATQ